MRSEKSSKIVEPTKLDQPAVPRRVILAASDRGALMHLSAIAPALEAISVEVLALAPGGALSDGLFPDGAMRTIPGGPWRAESADAGRAGAEIGRLVAGFAPHAIVVGHSHGGEVSIDDLALAAAPDPGATLVMQDFWGELKTAGDREAAHYLVLDQVAADVTRMRSSAAIHVVGSPKHAAYASLPCAAIRAEGRRRMGAGQGDVVVGYFGQNLLALGEPYRATLRDAAAAIRNDAGVAALIYRPHPREDADHIRACADILAESGKLVAVPDGAGQVEPWLLTVDTALCCFSTCAYDAIQLGLIDEASAPAVVYVNHVDAIDQYWRAASGLDELPPVAAGAALSSRSAPLADMLLRARDREARALLRAAARGSIPDPTAAPAIAARLIAAVAGERRLARAA